MTPRPDSVDAAKIDARDEGSTLVELLMVIVVLGIVMSSLSLAVITSLRAVSDTETRLDDARATRSLAAWLTSDTISAPPFLPETAQGGIVIDQDPVATNNNDCAAAGTNLLHLQWTEVTDVPRTFVANYRWELESSGEAKIVRYVCFSTGPGPFVMITSRTMTSGLTPSPLPTVTPIIDAATLNATSIQFELIDDEGEIVLVDTGSRNPADFFP